MRHAVVVVVLASMLLTPTLTTAEDPPGGKGWYQLEETVSVPFEGGPAQVRVRALLRQPVSKAPAPSPIGPAGGAASTAAAPLAVSPAVVGAGGGSVAVSREVAVTIRDVEERRIDGRSEITAPGPAPERRPGGVEVSRPTAGSAGAGGIARMIACEEHEAWLAKVLRLLGEEGARCETKGYGPG